MRVEVVDQPGALAGLTAVLAELGVHVASVDVLEVDGSTVVDELLLRPPERVSVQEVKDALRPGGRARHVGEAARFPLAQRALELGVPTSGRAGPDSAPLAVPSGWVLWVAPGVAAPQRIAVVARRLDVRFSATEAARLRAFATLLEQLTQASAA